MNQYFEVERNEYYISTDPSKIDLAMDCFTQLSE